MERNRLREAAYLIGLTGFLVSGAVSSAEAQTPAAPPQVESSKPASSSREIGYMSGVPSAPHNPDRDQPLVGVIDSGVRLDHPQIGDIVGAMRDFTSEGIYDHSGHGTTVILVTLRTHYELVEKLADMAPELDRPAAVAVAKIVGRRPVGQQTLADRMVEAIAWLSQINVKIVNISMAMLAGGADYSALCAEIAARTDMLFVITAGNEGENSVVYPAACPGRHVIVVGAVTSQGDVPEYSGPADLVAKLPPTLLSKADYFRELGDSRANSQDFSGAKAAYAEALQADSTPPTQALIHYGLGYVAQQENDRATALDHFKRAAESWPQYAESFVAISLMLTRDERYEEALQWLGQGLAIHPDHARLLDRHVRVLLDLARPEQALEQIAVLEKLGEVSDDLHRLKFAAKNFIELLGAVEDGIAPSDLLHFAAAQGDARLAWFLVRRFEIPLDEVPPSEKVPPLVIAALNGHRTVINVLLDTGADINVQGGELQLSPLMAAANGGQVETVKILIAKGAAIDRTDYFGFTALMSAAEQGYEEVVDVLLEAAADITPRSKDGLDALAYARRHGHSRIVTKIIAAEQK